MTEIFNIPLVLDADSSVGQYVKWIPSRSPHAVLWGSTGSGKSYCAKLILGRLSVCIPDAKIVVCDYKNDDFRFLTGSPHHYSYEDCGNGLDHFFEIFRKRQQGEDQSRSFRMLVFDEWASYISSLDKKIAEDAKKKLSTLLMLGRSFNCQVLIIQQRADAAYFATARDNFNLVIALGTLSKEGQDMFFSSFKDSLKPAKRLGEGYALINGSELRHIQVPTIRDNARLEKAISRLVQ